MAAYVDQLDYDLVQGREVLVDSLHALVDDSNLDVGHAAFHQEVLDTAEKISIKKTSINLHL